MKLEVCYYGNPVLRAKAQPVASLTPEVDQFIQDMIDTMLAYDGIGLAAPQVGKSLRIFVIREEIFLPNNQYTFGPIEVFINPVLSQPSKEVEVMAEGCLSLPGLHVEVERPLSIHIRYQDRKGEWKEETAKDFRARMLMHENDHLNGVLTIDRTNDRNRKQVEPLLKAIKQKHSS